MTDEIAKASKNLTLMEQFCQENKDDDDIMPTPEVFASVREFLTALSDECNGLPVPEPKLFDGHGRIQVYLGERPNHIIITFSPEGTFFYWPRHNVGNPRVGEGLANLISVIKEHI